MYRLTDSRRQKAKDILDGFRTRICKDGAFSTADLEKALRDCWDIGFKELEDIMLDLFRDDQYRFVAAYYMQHHQSATGPIARFKPHLAELYQVQRYDSADCVEARSIFWETFASSEAKELRAEIDALQAEWERLDNGTQDVKQQRVAESIERVQGRLQSLTGEQY